MRTHVTHRIGLAVVGLVVGLLEFPERAAQPFQPSSTMPCRGPSSRRERRETPGSASR
jgi:hypothetical protein